MGEWSYSRLMLQLMVLCVLHNTAYADRDASEHNLLNGNVSGWIIMANDLDRRRTKHSCKLLLQPTTNCDDHRSSSKITTNVQATGLDVLF